jgi:mannose-6-phosphate isomerase-like protein (cupin superfamily)
MRVMTVTTTNALVLQNRHTGEQLEFQRVVRDGQMCLYMRGSLPAHRQGPPLHVHFQASEEFHVISGTLSAESDGRRLQVRAGETAVFPPGSAHRWWNEGDEPLVVDGWAAPALDLDRHLQAVFEVVNSGAADRPPLFYMSHVAWRHRRTQLALFMPRPLQMIMLPLTVLVGTILGRYRGSDWPGAPARCQGAPLASSQPI